MQTKRLGKSDLLITPVGFGSWAEIDAFARSNTAQAALEIR